jgi:hypothetical protein
MSNYWMRLIQYGLPTALALGLSSSLQAIVAMPSPEAVVRAFVDAENAHSVERILATTAITLDVRLFRADGTAQYEKVRTRQEQRTTFADAIQKNPDSQFHIISVIVSGPVVITRDEATGLPQGAREFALTAYRVVNGRISQMWLLNTEGVKYAGNTPD